MLDTDTKRRIDNARDILVGKIPDPKAQVEQITIALIYKFMDDMDLESSRLGGEASFFTGEFEQYAWHRLMSPSLGGHERLNLYMQALMRMDENPNLPALFRNIFKNAYLPYNAPETLNLFVKEIDGFTYDHSERLGDAFEYLLMVLGSQGDAGQFRTPRHIIEFIVDCVNPTKTDRILDPACGTAGFLISAYKHILEQHGEDNPLTGAEREELMKNFTGYDISPDMVRLALVNLYLHQFPNPNIVEYDTLSSEDRWDEYAEVILANPPFMTPKGGIIPHKRFSIQANRSEVLFVDYIAEHLTPDGRAGVIVPEGIIFQSSNAYKNLRKMLVEDQYLYAVVSLPAGVFNPYSGVKTSILLMDRSIAKQTDQILFVKIEQDGFDLGAQRNAIEADDLPQALQLIRRFQEAPNSEWEENDLTITVKKEKIAEDGDFNLTGDRYKSLLPQDLVYPIVELGEVCEVNRQSDNPVDLFGDEEFVYIDISSVDSETGAISFENKLIGTEAPSRARRVIQNGDVLLSTVRPNLKSFALLKNAPEKALASTGFAVLTPSDKILPQYLYAQVLSEHMVDQMIARMGKGAYPSINQKDVMQLNIPLPPLAVQEEIVAEIESYQCVIDGARQVLNSYQPRIPIDPEWPMVDLGEVTTLKTGGTPTSRKKEYYEGGDVPWLVSGDIHKGIITDCEGRITRLGVENSNARQLPKNSVLIALNGQGKTRGTVALLEMENATCNQSLVSINPNDKNVLLSEFLYFQLKAMYQQIRNITGDNQRSGLNMPIIRKIRIPLPPLETQREIISQIEEERALVDANHRLIEIFEQKIEDKIDSIWNGKKEEE